MAEGIVIHDAALEISPEGVAALVGGQGAELRVTKIDLSVSQEALNTLVAGFAPAGVGSPAAAVSEGRLQLSGEKDGKRVALDLQLGGLRLQLTADGLRLSSE